MDLVEDVDYIPDWVSNTFIGVMLIITVFLMVVICRNCWRTRPQPPGERLRVIERDDVPVMPFVIRGQYLQVKNFIGLYQSI